MPKSDTVFTFLKGMGLIGGAMAGAFQSGLSQWGGEGWPDKLSWCNIIAGTLVAGATALVAFCSGSVATWRQAREGVTESPVAPVKSDTTAAVPAIPPTKTQSGQ